MAGKTAHQTLIDLEVGVAPQAGRAPLEREPGTGPVQRQWPPRPAVRYGARRSGRNCTLRRAVVGAGPRAIRARAAAWETLAGLRVRDARMVAGAICRAPAGVRGRARRGAHLSVQTPSERRLRAHDETEQENDGTEDPHTRAPREHARTRAHSTRARTRCEHTHTGARSERTRARARSEHSRITARSEHTLLSGGTTRVPSLRDSQMLRPETGGRQEESSGRPTCGPRNGVP